MDAFSGALKENDTDTFNGEVVLSRKVADELFGTGSQTPSGFFPSAQYVCV